MLHLFGTHACRHLDGQLQMRCMIMYTWCQVVGVRQVEAEQRALEAKSSGLRGIGKMLLQAAKGRLSLLLYNWREQCSATAVHGLLVSCWANLRSNFDRSRSEGL